MKKRFLLLGTCFLVSSLAVGKSPFLIQSQSASKNELKENIGEEIKSALHTCASIIDELGKVQQEVASLQRKLLARVEKLIENDRCFKKAKRSELTDALTIMHEVKQQLQVQERTVKQLAVRMNKNSCLGVGGLPV